MVTVKKGDNLYEYKYKSIYAFDNELRKWEWNCLSFHDYFKSYYMYEPVYNSSQINLHNKLKINKFIKKGEG